VARGHAMFVDGKMLSVTKYRDQFLLEQAHDLQPGALIQSLTVM